MTETPFFFPNHGYSLFGVLHEPGAAAALPAFVFCHPFGEEKLWTHRVFVGFARRLAEKGHAVLRFDYMGNGDSDGEFRESSVTTARSDVRCAIELVRRRTGADRVALLGLRFGATIASLVAEELPEPEIDRLILWAPVVDGGRYAQELLRINLMTQMAVYKEVRKDRESLAAAMAQGGTVNVDGYELAFPLHSELSAIRLAADRKRHRGPCLIVQIGAQPRPSPELQELAACYGEATMSVAREEPFWKEIARSYQRPAVNLFSTTLDWLGES